MDHVFNSQEKNTEEKGGGGEEEGGGIEKTVVGLTR